MKGEAAALSVTALLEFPDKAAVHAFYADAEYAPWLESRNAGANGQVLILDARQRGSAVDGGSRNPAAQVLAGEEVAVLGRLNRD